MGQRTPDRNDFTAAELRLVEALRTPRQVQLFLRRFPYNWEKTLRTFRGVVSVGRASCLEAVLVSATVLEQHGYPPLALDLESEDGLDHVLFIYQQEGRWGTVARSRDEGLHGRRPVFPTVRALVGSRSRGAAGCPGGAHARGRRVAPDRRQRRPESAG